MTSIVRLLVVGDASQLKGELGKATTEVQSFGDRAKSAAATFVGAFAVAGFFKAGIDELKQAAQVSAQTSAALASTGGAAGVSAGHIHDLAGELMKMSGTDDEVIQASENLLLQFGNIKNAAGEGNDVFDQATKASLDLATALGIDASDAAGKLGKALEDPAHASKALRGLNILLTDSQKASIKSFTDVGDVASAQKVILEQVNQQVGGSAEAYGKTLPGQIDKATESFKNLAGGVVGLVGPALSLLAGAAQKLFEGFQALPTGVQQFIAITLVATAACVKFGVGFDTIAIAAYNATGAVTTFLVAAAPIAAALIAVVALSAGAVYGIGKLAESAAKGDFGTFADHIDRVDVALKELGTTGRVIGILAEQLPALEKGFKSTDAGATGWLGTLTKVGSFLPGMTGQITQFAGLIDGAFDKKSAEEFQKQVDVLDKRLVELFHQDPSAAASAFDNLRNQLILSGASADQVNAAFDDFNSAQNDAKDAANGAAGAMRDEEQAMKDLNDKINGIVNPLFDLNKAFDDNRKAQQDVAAAQLDVTAKTIALTEAQRLHGDSSLAALQASVDLATAQGTLSDANTKAAQSARDVEEAQNTLEGAVKSGTTSFQDASTKLDEWVAAGLITQQSADDQRTKFFLLALQVQQTPDSKTIPTSAPGLDDTIRKFQTLNELLTSKVPFGTQVNVAGQTGTYQVIGVVQNQPDVFHPNGAGGMMVPGPYGKPTQVTAHGGEELVPASRAGSSWGRPSSVGGDVYLDGEKVGRWMERELAARVGAGR